MTDNEKYVKRSQALITKDDPQRHEEVMSASRSKASAPFRYAGSPFAALAVVKSMTGLPYRHLQGLEDASIHEDSKSGHTTARIAPFTNRSLRLCTVRGQSATRYGWVWSTCIQRLQAPA